MITVEAKLFATLRRHFPNLGIGEALKVELAEGVTVNQLLEALHLPRDQVKIVFVNNTIQKGHHPLSNEDEVGIFPPLGGG